MDIIAAHPLPRQEEDGDEEAAEPPATINQALNGLERLLSFKEHEPYANSMELMTLMRMKRSLQQAELNRSQGT
ncbi:BgTH12-06154 [Blumeria graminis f. sp. triticale]|uniref:Bgt-51573 n=2 Tax=Blumeria graminis TaxID=34373 RepID=A0A9X9ML75_BLUGR|nr:BgTH12-06154 [Blumeria graminis f. sp. triticale]VDB91283.1 Bgt-51573 [Blumeria graminis f. sp. tritici]